MSTIRVISSEGNVTSHYHLNSLTKDSEYVTKVYLSTGSIAWLNLKRHEGVGGDDQVPVEARAGGEAEKQIVAGQARP